jgi:hypothetical protein
MRKRIPKALEREHVLAALADLDAGVSHPFFPAMRYDLIYRGKRYPPKAAVGLAVKHLNGRILQPTDFSAGEAPGQANYILRQLQFDVEPRSKSNGNSYITSRSFRLPSEAREMRERIWFNMWKRQHWPYIEPQAGSTLFWYDRAIGCIVWKCRIIQIERFEYENKEVAREYILQRFDRDVITDHYFINASDNGYCVAYKADAISKVWLPKPPSVRMPVLGWLRGSSDDGIEWLGGLTTRRELTQLTNEIENSGYFVPTSNKDERKKILREVVARRGQPKFRKKLIEAYRGRCAVTDCDARDALEAAHIVPYRGPAFDHVTNGLLLRADIHTLFDLNLIGIKPRSFTIHLGDAIQGTAYDELEGKNLRLTHLSKDQPSAAALSQRWVEFERSNDRDHH